MCGRKETLDEVEDEDESKERRGGVAVIHSSTAEEENSFNPSGGPELCQQLEEN